MLRNHARIAILVLLISSHTVLLSCRAEQNIAAEGTLVSYSGCKNNGSGSLASRELYSIKSGQECIEYSYDGNLLRIKHLNASFNCCLEKIVGNVSIEGGIIKIESEGILENGQGCHCNCLYDVEFEIRGLVPGPYVIACASFANSIEIDLKDSSSGLRCEVRNGYPWK